MSMAEKTSKPRISGSLLSYVPHFKADFNSLFLNHNSVLVSNEFLALLVFYFKLLKKSSIYISHNLCNNSSYIYITHSVYYMILSHLNLTMNK